MDQGDNMSRQSKRFFYLSLTLSAISLTACTKGLNVSDQFLTDEMEKCHNEQNKTPGRAVICGNYQEECERRGKKTGNYFC